VATVTTFFPIITAMAHEIIVVSSPKYLPCACRLLSYYSHCRQGDQSRRHVAEALASSLHICELLVFQLLLYVTHPLDYSSAYTCFPFFTPKMKASLTRQGIAGKYTFTHPVPVSVPDILNISLASGLSSVTPPTSRSHMESKIRLLVADLFSIVAKRHSAMPTWLWLAFSFLESLWPGTIFTQIS
jgi:hypothetical protein